MQKLLAATFSVLGLALITATPDQAQAQTWTWTQTVSGQQSGSSIRTETISRTINEVVQSPVTKTFENSYTNVYPVTTITRIGSGWNSQAVPPLRSISPITHQLPNYGNSFNPVIVPQPLSIQNLGGYQLNMKHLGR